MWPDRHTILNIYEFEIPFKFFLGWKGIWKILIFPFKIVHLLWCTIQWSGRNLYINIFVFFFGKTVVNIARFQSWDQSQIKGLVILHNISRYVISMYSKIEKNIGLKKILCSGKKYYHLNSYKINENYSSSILLIK